MSSKLWPSVEGVSPDSAGSNFFASNDGGALWRGDWGGGSSGGGLIRLAVGPTAPGRVYAVSDNPGIAAPDVVVWFDVAGTWGTGGGGGPVPDTMTTTRAYRSWGGLVVDPIRRGTLYANIEDPYVGNGRAVFVTRSGDDGLHWTMVMTPTASPPLRTFRVGIDTHEGTALVGYTDDPTVPADRRYLSPDGATPGIAQPAQAIWVAFAPPLPSTTCLVPVPHMRSRRVASSASMAPGRRRPAWP